MTRPSFILHTSDLTHLSKPAEFDTLQALSERAAGDPIEGRRARFRDSRHTPLTR